VALRYRPSDEAADLGEAHEINVTPLIDVMLVLLIVFMIAAPLATVDVPVDLPNAAAQPTPPDATPVTLTLRADKSLYLGETLTNRDALAPAIDQITGGDHDRRISLRADRSVDYGALMDLMNLLRRAGYLKVALIGLDAGDAR
jgi:biopolymer transport protein ExbD